MKIWQVWHYKSCIFKFSCLPSIYFYSDAVGSPFNKEEHDIKNMKSGEVYKTGRGGEGDWMTLSHLKIRLPTIDPTLVIICCGAVHRMPILVLYFKNSFYLLVSNVYAPLRLSHCSCQLTGTPISWKFKNKGNT